MPQTPWWAVRFELLAEAAPGFSGPIDLHAEGQVDLVSRVASLGPGSRVLDVGCGAGRHSILMAERGFDVTGIDLSPRLLKLARERWAERNPDRPGPLFAPGDMRWPPVAGPFDAAIMLDVTLGVFGDDSDHIRTLAAIRERLRDGGNLVLELFNPYFWAHNQLTRYFAAGSLAPGADVVRTYRFDAVHGLLVDRVVLFDEEGRHRVPDQELRCWTPPELVAMLTAAGFSRVRIFGSAGWEVPEEPAALQADSSVYMWALAEA